MPLQETSTITDHRRQQIFVTKRTLSVLLQTMANTSGGASPSDVLLANDDPTILLLEGWTPGPLTHLHKFLKGGNSTPYKILEPSLPMPPFVGLWWYDRNVIVMFGGLIGIIWSGCRFLVQVASAYGGTARILCSFAVLAVILFWIRLVACVAVRSSIQRGVDICLQQMRDHNVVAIVGFSWGGAVLAELMAQGQVGVCTTQPAALLIAPATAAVASAAFQQDAALRIEEVQHLVHVVHATHDRTVCPHPERWESVHGLEYTMLHDVHVFHASSSKRAIAGMLMSLLQEQATWNATPRADALDQSSRLTAGERSPQRRPAPVLGEPSLLA